MAVYRGVQTEDNEAEGGQVSHTYYYYLYVPYHISGFWVRCCREY